MEGNLGNATTWHQLHWWKSPRWIVIRIEALAVVAIIISFFLAAFGSFRRWSNSWIVQKGFFVAQVLSLSLGTYSMGLMQSSSVKSEMYPIWTVSLFTLFGCIDPVTTYNGLDYKGPLSKVVYGICLNCGYVLLMSISTITNIVGKAAIIALSAITFIKGFHRSFALVQQIRMRDMACTLDDSNGEICIIRKDEPLYHYDKRYMITIDIDTDVCQANIEQSIRKNKDARVRSCYDICVALCLSNRLQRHFLGIGYRVVHPETLNGIDFKWALKVIEIELAFMYDAFFTGNSFLHYYQAKTSSLWALASLAGICFVLVATAIPGGMTRNSGASAFTEVVDTTTTDLAITFGILVSLVLLQLTQLVQSWTSNWARAAVACACAMKEEKKDILAQERGLMKLSGWMRLKVCIATSTNLFQKFLWQDKISQYSMLPEPRLLAGTSKTKGEPKCWRCVDLVHMLGLHYIWQVIFELFSRDINKGDGVNLDEDVEASIPEWISPSEIEGDGMWLSKIEAEQTSPSDIQAERISPSSEIEGDGLSPSSEREGEWISLSSEIDEGFRLRASKLKAVWVEPPKPEGDRTRYGCGHLFQTLGLHYIWLVIFELLSSDTNKRSGLMLDEDVKGSVIDFLGQIQSDTLDRNWLSSLPEEPQIRYFLPYFSDPRLRANPEVLCYRYTSCVLTWHIATWYCELAEQKTQISKAEAAVPRPGNYFKRRRGEGTKTRDHRHVANALSQYCIYLVKSAPELLPGPVVWTKLVYDRFVGEAKETIIEGCGKDINLEYMSSQPHRHRIFCTDWYAKDFKHRDFSNYFPKTVESYLMHNGLALATKLLLMHSRDEIWKTLALVWVQLLVYASPYGNAEAHMRHLAQGGEFITHLWALLYHLHIREWKVQGNMVEITKSEDIDRIVAEDDQAVVALLDDKDGTDQEEVASASRLVDGVRYYYTSNSRISKEYFGIECNNRSALAFVKKEANDHKLTFYEGEFRAYAIARFVENKIALARDHAQAQSSEDDGGRGRDAIEEETPQSHTKKAAASRSTVHDPIRVKKGDARG